MNRSYIAVEVETKRMAPEAVVAPRNA